MGEVTGGVTGDKVKARVAGRHAAEEFLTLVLEESNDITKKHGIEGGLAFLLSLAEQLGCVLPKGPVEASDAPEEAAWQGAVKLCDEILGDIDSIGPDPSDGCRSFVDSVAATVGGIRGNIMRSKRVSLAQEEALQNMHAGVLRWLA